jgi:hypothetical protein
MKIEGRAIQGQWLQVAFLGIGLVTSALAAKAAEQDWMGRFPLTAGGQVAVENIQGDVFVEGWDRAEVNVAVTKTALRPTRSLNEVKIAVEFNGRSLTLRTVYPKDLDEPVRVSYRLHVPRQVRLDHLRTLEGDIVVQDVEGAIDARTLNGDIIQENVAGSVVAHALTGDVAVSLRALPDAKAPLVLDTVNGNLNLLLPSHANADLELSTVAGRIEGSYAFNASAVPGDMTRHARVGHGGVRVSLRTIRGNIEVGERNDVL